MPAELSISYVPPLYVGATWPLIKTYVHQVCDMSGGRATPVKTLADLMEGTTQLWVAHDENQTVKAYATTRICQYDAVRLLGVEMIGGEDMETWLTGDNIQIMVQFAKDNGCEGLEGYGRGMAWARKLKDYGWSVRSTTIEMRF